MYTYNTFYNVKPEDVKVTLVNGELVIRVLDGNGSHTTTLMGSDVVAIARAIANVQVVTEKVDA
jgi:hypothetical protein